MSKFIFAVLKKKSILIPNGDKTRYVIISGCTTESVNGTYYQMDPITINDKTYNLCFTNGIYMLKISDFYFNGVNLYELDNSSLINKFYFVGGGMNQWRNSDTGELVPEMNIEKIGDWPSGGYD